MTKYITTIVVAIVLTVLAYGTYSYIYAQQYVQDSNTTATKGIFFKSTLNLEAYQNVSKGNGWLGKFERYSRSDRHTEVLTIYCKDYCKK